MRDALRVQLPAGGQDPARGFPAEPTLRRRKARQLQDHDADPMEPPEHGQRLVELRLVTVVEADDDRSSARQRRGVAPRVHSWSRVTAVQPAAFSAPIWAANSLGRTYSAGNGAPG